MFLSAIPLSSCLLPYNLIHMLGVAFGLGIATGMDVLLMRNILRKAVLSATHINSIVLLSRFVSIAVVMLWLSGIGFLYCYYVSAPEKLQNPKIWSKLSIVFVLTVNGLFIHYFVLPRLRRCVGKITLMAFPYKVLSLFFATGAISFVSWYFPFFYGTLPGLNFTFSFLEFSMAYAVAIVCAVAISLSILGFLYANMLATRLDRTALTMDKREPLRKLVSVPLRKRRHLIKRFTIPKSDK